MSVKFYIQKKALCLRRGPFLYVLAIPFISKRSFLQLQ
jgi:hypothetical protein